jgi:signal transduction histidine kinase
MHLAESLAKACRVDISLELSGELPRVGADAVQLQLLILHLIQNAIEAIEANESVDRRIVIRSVCGNSGGVVVSVEDTGSGLAPQARANLFRPFNTTKPNGVGLALLSCLRIAEAHGGLLSADNIAGSGARFTLTLPQSAEVENARPDGA